MSSEAGNIDNLQGNGSYTLLVSGVNLNNNIMNREELNKLFDEHFIDDCNEVYDSQNEIVDFAEKAVKLFAIPVVMRSFSLEDLRKAFEAGRTVENYKGEWQETYNDKYTSAKYDRFEDWFKNYP